MFDNIISTTLSAPYCNKNVDINLLKANVTDNINLEDTCVIKFFLSFAFQKAYVFGEYKYITKKSATIKITADCF
jgi:hypothetical protein